MTPPCDRCITNNKLIAAHYYQSNKGMLEVNCLLHIPYSVVLNCSRFILLSMFQRCTLSRSNRDAVIARLTQKAGTEWSTCVHKRSYYTSDYLTHQYSRRITRGITSLWIVARDFCAPGRFRNLDHISFKNFKISNYQGYIASLA